LSEKVFEDLKVAAFCWGIAGPLMVKYLAEHGATVVRIESASRIDMVRLTAPYKDKISGRNRSLFFANYNENQYSASVDLKKPEGLKLAKRIVEWSDIVVESMVPGVMKRLGLSYEELKKIRKDIVMISTCNQGQTGRNSLRKGFGTQLTAAAGFAYLTGYSDRPPIVPGMMGYTDVCSARLGTSALIAALIHRKKTGKGQYIDISQLEAGVIYLSAQMLDYFANQRVACRIENKSYRASPHGAYPCKGDDEWCTISVYDDGEWNRLTVAMETPEWARQEKFATLEGRKKHESELDARIGEWTRGYSSQEVLDILQEHGVRSGIVQDSRGLYKDPQLDHRNHFAKLDHSEIGEYRCEKIAFRLSEASAECTSAAPCLGEHNHYVCTQILGMSDGEFVQLLEDGVFD